MFAQLTHVCVCVGVKKVWIKVFQIQVKTVLKKVNEDERVSTRWKDN